MPSFPSIKTPCAPFSPDEPGLFPRFNEGSLAWPKSAPMDTIAHKPNQTLRAILVIAAITVLGIWAWAWMPVVEAWNDPSDGGFSAIPAVLATFTLLPLGTFALFKALRGHRDDLKEARITLIVVAIGLAVIFGIEQYGNIFEAQYASQA